MAQFARPDADITDGGFLNQAGGNVDLFASLDEVSFNDADYIWAPNAVFGGTDSCTIGLSNITKSLAQGRTYRWRYRIVVWDGSSGEMRVALFQGGTLIAQDVLNFTSADVSGAFVERSLALTQAQYDSITDFTDLRARFEVQDVNTDNTTSDVRFSWWEFETPDAVTGQIGAGGGGFDAWGALPWATIPVSGPASFSIDAQPGSFTVTGVAATTAAGRAVDAQPGSFTLTGFAATLAKGLQLDAQPASFAVTGIEAGLLAGRALDAQPGSIALTGFDATLAAGKTFNAEPGTFVLTGMLAELVRGYVADAQPGSFVLTGNAAALIADRVLSADPGAIILTGTEAGLLAGRLVIADPGVYVVTGFDATLVFSGATQAFEINAEPGVFVITGAEAGLLIEKALNGEPGSFTVTGVNAGLAAERLLNAEPGTLTLTGFPAWAGLNLEQFPEGGAGEAFISILNE